MATVTFDEKKRDKKLVQEIEKYQKEQNLKSRIDAVRKLCEMALKIKEDVNE